MARIVRRPEDAARYTLRLYDEPLLEFVLSPEDPARRRNGCAVSDAIVLSEKTHLFPYGLTASCEGIESWLRDRIIPENRYYADEILESLGLRRSDMMGILDTSKGVSLNDSYLVSRSDETGSFAECNAYENPFDDALGAVALTGRATPCRRVSVTPELTTGGMLPKSWGIEGTGIYLYKGGTSGFANSGLEPYSEYFASQIARKMGLDAVEYGLTFREGRLVSRCGLFTDIDTSFVSAGVVVPQGGILACISFFDSLGARFSEAIRSMIVFDALVYQQDRHFGNFGVLRDNRTGKITAPAPVFDNGASLFCYAMADEIETGEKLENYAQTRRPPYRETYSELCAISLKKLQRRQVKRLIDFSFERHPEYAFPEERLRAIERHLQRRVARFLNNER